MNDHPLVSVVVATYNRKQYLEKAIDSVLKQEYDRIEVIVVCNSTDETPLLFDEGGKFCRDIIKYYHFDSRMGAPKARNIGFKKANGEILISLDDDAYFKSANIIQQVIEEFSSNPDLGILTFKSVYPNGELIESDFPYIDKNPLTRRPNPNSEFETSFFVGVGNAIRTEVLEETGLYPENYEYGYEELDLSLRVIDCGYKIVYYPQIEVVHDRSESGRYSKNKVIRKNLENRIEVSLKYLPIRYTLITIIVWSIYLFYQSGFNLRLILNGYRNLLLKLPTIIDKRDPIQKDKLHYIKKISDRHYL